MVPCPYRGEPTLSAWIHLSDPAETSLLKVFTPANRLVAHWVLGALPAGESKIGLPLENAHAFANGLYYIVLEVPKGRLYGKWVILR
jgi:hypothetical protein